MTVHAGKLERWLGQEKIELLQSQMRGWYGPPINIRDVPGSLWITGDGDFVGDFERGSFASALDNLRDHLKQFWARVDRERSFREHAFGVGFTSISDALSRSSQGFGQALGGSIVKVGATGNVLHGNSLWAATGNPPAGGAASAAPAGASPTKTTTGALAFDNPSTGTLHLIGADFACTVVNLTLLLYDRLFHVIKTMNSTAAEAVSGIPTRYQSTVPADSNYAGGNFVFPEVVTTLGATAHNWTGTYTDQAGVASTFQSGTGLASVAAQRVDLISGWFLGLESGDTGVKAITAMTCSALVATGAINYVMAHPIGIMAFPVINSLLPFDWLTNRQLAPRIFNDACLALMELPKPVITAATYQGMLHAVSAAP